MPQQPPTAASFYVRNLPGLDPASSLALYGGTLPAATVSDPPDPTTDSDAALYFLLAVNRHIPKRQRLVIWLNGGPGCSSFDGALIEVGPIRIDVDGNVHEVKNGTAWNEYSNVLFLDQPAGTGFSYVNTHDDVRELTAAALQVVAFLDNFYAVFPEYRAMDTYLAGESYAGQWIPYLANALLSQTTPIRLQGLLIGNGWFSPRHQYPAYLDYIVERGLISKGSRGYREIAAAVKTCVEKLDELDQASGGTGKGTILVPSCEVIVAKITEATKKDDLCLNLYDTSQYLPCGTEWPPQIPQITSYLRRADVIQALHAPPSKKWQHCSDNVGSHFWTANSIPSVALLPKLLESGLQILLFNGDLDAMCPGTGVQAMISDLTWNGATGFNGTLPSDWSVDSTLVGDWTTSRNLTYVNIFHSSHMVPLSSPLAAHDMLLRFLSVDTLHAAGPSARIPSRVGVHETEAVLGATHPDGSTLPGAEEAAAAAGAGSEAEGGGSGKTRVDGFDTEHELLFGPRRTVILLLLLLGAGVALWALVRWGRRRRRERYTRLKGKGRSRGRREGGGGGGGGGRERERRDDRDRDRERGEEAYHDEYRSEAARRGIPAAYTQPEPMETVEVFDVGDEDEDYDHVEREEGMEMLDEGGDLGRVENPWRAVK